MPQRKQRSNGQGLQKNKSHLRHMLQLMQQGLQTAHGPLPL